ncbi:protein FAM237B [Protopterus annectens]|uniref:protein FAM237B n=1 Tax=Protopterus annectens TaxID=7888 RepID=UPI001CFA7E13|nr:protein FAM237B [Protopterus annectens]
MEAIGSRWYLQLACLLMMGTVCVQPSFYKGNPNSAHPWSVDEAIDHQCWGRSSFRLIELKKLKVTTVRELWDFMQFLKESENLKYQTLFLDLAQLFWDMYVDCVLSSTHGLGRRQALPMRYALKNALKTSTDAVDFAHILQL